LNFDFVARLHTELPDTVDADSMDDVRSYCKSRWDELFRTCQTDR
jgi:muconolactone delta-isomerase